MATWPTIPAQPAVGSQGQASWADAVIQALQVFNSASTAYTPVWTGTTNPVINNGSITGAYFLAGKWCWGAFHIVCGSATTYGTGSYAVTLPPGLTGAARYGVYDVFGTGMAVSGASRFPIITAAGGVSPTGMILVSNSGLMTSASPVALASGSVVTGSFMFETT